MPVFYLVVAPEDTVFDEIDDFIKKANIFIKIGEAETATELTEDELWKAMVRPEVQSAYQQGCCEQMIDEDTILLAMTGR